MVIDQIERIKHDIGTNCNYSENCQLVVFSECPPITGLQPRRYDAPAACDTHPCSSRNHVAKREIRQ